MIEIKQQPGPVQPKRYQCLARSLAPLRPVHDFHLMALNPVLLEARPWGPSVCLLVARLGLKKFSHEAVERGIAGICGHYALMRRRHISRHHRWGQQVGTGFIASRACLYREVNRGVTWLFSNHAEKMQKICQETRLA
jgi:glycerophosphoryl diester phosphodiesterase